MKLSHLIIAVVTAGAVTTAFFWLREPRVGDFAKLPHNDRQSPHQTEAIRSPQALSTKGISDVERSAGSQTPTAPWAVFSKRYEAGDYGWILANARSFPEAGSYSYGIKVLFECLDLFGRGTFDVQAAAIEKGSSGESRDRRLAALRSLFTRCSNVGSVEDLQAQKKALTAEARLANDAIERLRKEVTQLRNTTQSREERQARLIEILQTRDPEALMALRPVLTTRGSSLDGVPIPQSDLPAFGLAWDLSICAHYRACQPAHSFANDMRCVVHDQCDYLDTFQMVQQYTPPFMMSTVRDYYSRIDSDLTRANFEAFGVPSPTARR